MLASVVNSVILAGGASLRMGVDKALLSYHGEPELTRLCRLLGPLTLEVCIAAREGQLPKEALGGCRLLPDTDEDVGPLEGLLSAFAWRDQCAWLAVAVDMPNITTRTLSRLLARRDSRACATAYRNPSNGLPEPVLAIYEPSILPYLLEAKRTRRYSLMLLKDVPVRLVDAEAPAELANVNDPDGYRQLRSQEPPNR